MKESAEEKARQEKLTRYLLGETEDEERLEIEKLCNQKQEWRQDKQRISRTLSLMEDACSEQLKELDGTSLQLPEEQRSKVLATLKNREPSDPLPEPKNPDQNPKKNEGKNLKLNFWIPLGAAALQFPQAHQIISSVIPGPRSELELLEIISWQETKIPIEFWTALKDKNLLDIDAPTPQ